VKLLFLHATCPAQFGPTLGRIAARPGVRGWFASRFPGPLPANFEAIPFAPTSGATRQTHYASRTFENMVWHSHAALAALQARPDVQPDVIIAHSGFLSTVALAELYPGVPIVNYFEFFYHARQSDLDFRPEWPPPEEDRLRARFRNAGLLLDLHYCTRGQTPTRWQHSLLPAEYHAKVKVVFDGVDTQIWKPGPRRKRDGMLITYAARGFEAMRGFDIFMQVAQRIIDRIPNVRFAVAGNDRIHYGGDARQIGGESFKNYVLSKGNYDLSKFDFVGTLPPEQLAQLFRDSDLHLYLTAPFVLSWSLFNALACGATVLASDTAPVRELIAHGKNGLLAGFFDVDALVQRACEVLADPAAHRGLGESAVESIRENYSLEVCEPELWQYYAAG
jgi:glycosyltransferase involved in cell wall biosynthesis